MKILDPIVVKKISEKIDKPEKYVKEQISKRGRRLGILSEAAMVNWAIELKIPISSQLRKLSPDIRAEANPRTINYDKNGPNNFSSLRIIRIGKDENALINQLWFQIIVLGISVNVASQVLGTMLTNFFKLTNH